MARDAANGLSGVGGALHDLPHPPASSQRAAVLDMAQGAVLHEDLYDVISVNPEGKKFDRGAVQMARIGARARAGVRGWARGATPRDVY